MRGRSPPKHRHDGTSPLPLGIDWSPPPKIWNGRDTVWPHDPCTGWSYCVNIPSWVAVPKSRSSTSDPIVFYRVQVGIQSPEGVTTTRGVLRRFNDFLKLIADLKTAFPKKILPSAPPKGLVRMKSRTMLEERRCSLEEWMSRLLSDIDISRSMAVASFLELEPAVRSALREATQQPSEVNHSTSSDNLSQQIHPSEGLDALGSSSSIASDYGSDTPYENFELGSHSNGRDDCSELGLEELTLNGDFTNPMENLVSVSNIDEGLLMGENILDQIEGFRKHKINARHITDNGNLSKSVPLASNGVVSMLVGEHEVIEHLQKHRNENLGSDMSLYNVDNEITNSWTPNLLSEASLDHTSQAEDPESQFHNVGQITLPTDEQPVTLLRDEQPRLDRILMGMNRRLMAAKTDMEDLLSRLNQEMAVKEYLMSKVKDLEVELETTKEKSKENLQQALLLEKERITKMQWDMEELRRKSVEMELKLKSQEDFDLPAESTSSSIFLGKDELLEELEATKGQLNSLLEQHTELEVKSKSDIKVLVKEVKSLRRSQHELKQKLDESSQEKSKVEQLLQREREQNEHALAERRKLLHDCQTLRNHLQNCHISLANNNFASVSSWTLDVLDLLADSDNQLSILLDQMNDLTPEIDSQSDDDNMKMVDDELRLVLREIFSSNAKLRKQMNFLIHSALQNGCSTHEEGKEFVSKSVLRRLLEQ